MSSSIVLDGIEKLNSRNYTDWAWAMEAYLTRKEIWDVVTGAVTLPPGSQTSKAVLAFRRKQQLARAEIILHVDTSQRPHTASSDPKEVWDMLKKVHQPAGLNSRFALLRQFFSLVKHPEQSMSEWIGVVKDLGGRLSDPEHVFPDELLILKITTGLPESYDSFRVALDLINEDLLTLDYVTSHLMTESLRQETDTSYESQLSLSAQNSRAKGKGRNVQCFKCRKRGHYANDCPEKDESEANEVGETGEANQAVTFPYSANIPHIT